MRRVLIPFMICFFIACNPRVNMDASYDATCTAKCYAVLNIQGYIAAKCLGQTPEGYLVCECLESKTITIGDRAIPQMERKIVVERKSEKVK